MKVIPVSPPQINTHLCLNGSHDLMMSQQRLWHKLFRPQVTDQVTPEVPVTPGVSSTGEALHCPPTLQHIFICLHCAFFSYLLVCVFFSLYSFSNAKNYVITAVNQFFGRINHVTKPAIDFSNRYRNGTGISVRMRLYVFTPLRALGNWKETEGGRGRGGSVLPLHLSR